MDEIKECVCGDSKTALEEVTIMEKSDLHAHYILCESCLLKGPPEPTATAAIESWNRLIDNYKQWTERGIIVQCTTSN